MTIIKLSFKDSEFLEEKVLQFPETKLAKRNLKIECAGNMKRKDNSSKILKD